MLAFLDYRAKLFERGIDLRYDGWLKEYSVMDLRDKNIYSRVANEKYTADLEDAYLEGHMMANRRDSLYSKDNREGVTP